MEPKDIFMQKIASVVADIPGDAIDQEIYTKFAKDVTGGVIAGRSFIHTTDDIDSKIKLAQRAKRAEEHYGKKKEKKQPPKEEGGGEEGSGESGGEGGGEKKESPPKEEGGGGESPAPTQPGMGAGPVETAPAPDDIVEQPAPAGGGGPGIALEAAAVGGAVEVAKKVMKGSAEQMSMNRQMGAM